MPCNILGWGFGVTGTYGSFLSGGTESLRGTYSSSEYRVPRNLSRIFAGTPPGRNMFSIPETGISSPLTVSTIFGSS